MNAVSVCLLDKVFRPNCSTREVYEKAAKNVAISVVGGMNCECNLRFIPISV